MQTWLKGFSLLSLSCLALFLVGPLMDHHFAERLPTHGHIEVGGPSGLPHLHGYEIPHQHTHASAPLLASGGQAAARIAIAAQDALTAEVTAPVLAAGSDANSLGAPAPTALLPAAEPAAAFFQELSPSPPRPPPRG